jgi:transposase
MFYRSISRRYRWKVQGRLAALKYTAAYGIRPAAARFGLDRKTVRAWRARFKEVGTVGLVRDTRSAAAGSRIPWWS